MTLATLIDVHHPQRLSELSSRVVAAQCHIGKSLSSLDNLPNELQHLVSTYLPGLMLKMYIKNYHATLYDALLDMTVDNGQRLLIQCMELEDHKMDRQVQIVKDLFQLRRHFNPIIHPLGLFYNVDTDKTEPSSKRPKHDDLCRNEIEKYQFYTVLSNGKNHCYRMWDLPSIPKGWPLPKRSTLFHQFNEESTRPKHLASPIVTSNLTSHQIAILTSACVASQSNQLAITLLLLFQLMNSSCRLDLSLKVEAYSMMAINLAKACMIPNLVLDCFDRMSEYSQLASDQFRNQITRQQVFWIWGLYRQEADLSRTLWKHVPVASFWFKKVVLVRAHSCWNELEDALIEWAWARQIYRHNNHHFAQWNYHHQKLLELDQDLLNLIDRPHLTADVENVIEACIGINFLYHGMLDQMTCYGTQINCLDVKRWMMSADRALSFYNKQQNPALLLWIHASSLATEATQELSDWLEFENDLEELTKIHDKKARVEYSWNRCRHMFSHFIIRIVVGKFQLSNEEYILKILEAYRCMSGGRHYRIKLLENFLKWWKNPSSFTEVDRQTFAVGSVLKNTEQTLETIQSSHDVCQLNDEALLQTWFQQESIRLPDILQFGRESWQMHPYL